MIERLITALPALIFAGAMLAAAVWAVVHAIRGDRHLTRRHIRRLESYANHPGARRLIDDIHNQPREEGPQP